MKKNNKGFSLVELLAVIVVLAIVAAVTMTVIVPIISDKPAEAAVINLREINATAEKVCASTDMGISEYGEISDFNIDCTTSVGCSLNPTNPREFVNNLKVVGDYPDKLTMRLEKCVVQESCIHYSMGKFDGLTIKLIDGKIEAKQTTAEWKC